ncbi:putative vacuolar protein sorting protein 26 related protein [Helianthus anomalus]
MSVEIKLSRSNRTYRPNDPLRGNIITRLPSSISHRGILLTLNASVNLQVRGGSAGFIESIYGVLKPIRIVKKSIQVQPSGKISAGTTQIPFSIILNDGGKDDKFYETFHGENISIQYLLNVDVVRGYLHKSLSATVEFIVESEFGKDLEFLGSLVYMLTSTFHNFKFFSTAILPERPISPEMVFFYITQDTQRHSLLPELKSGGFKISGRICTQCLVSDPLVGELTVEASAVPVYSIDIHLLRVESIMVGENIATETSIVQTTQAPNIFFHT